MKTKSNSQRTGRSGSSRREEAQTSPRLTIKDRAKIISRNSRESMRYCALQYRKARKRGSVYWMLRWLFNASQMRDCAQGILEAA